MSGGNDGGVAESDAHAGDAAGGEGPERVGKLVAAVNHVVPGREPHGDALADGVRDAEKISGGESGADEGEADDRDEGAAARDSVEREEQAGEDERRAHISLQEEEGHAKAPRRRRRAA